MKRTCRTCGRPARGRWCPACQPELPASPTSWNGMRDKNAQRRFALAVKRRDGFRCTVCGATTDLHAAHVPGSPPLTTPEAYEPRFGVTLCRAHHKAIDKWAR